MKIRKAKIDDVSVLSMHHVKMFKEIFFLAGKTLDDNIISSLQHNYQEKIRNQLPTGQCQSVVVEYKNKIIASGALTIISHVPVPTDLNHEVAYVHSIYTEKNYRKKGLANSILIKLKALCQEANIKRVFLNSSSEGKSIYEKFGFTPAPDSMRLFL